MLNLGSNAMGKTPANIARGSKLCLMQQKYF